MINYRDLETQGQARHDRVHTVAFEMAVSRYESGLERIARPLVRRVLRLSLFRSSASCHF